MIQGPLKVIKCVTIEPNGHICSRWMGDLPAGKVNEGHFHFPNCGQSWHVRQNENGILYFQRIKKTGKYYEDDGFRVIVEDKPEGETAHA